MTTARHTTVAPLHSVATVVCVPRIASSGSHPVHRARATGAPWRVCQPGKRIHWAWRIGQTNKLDQGGESDSGRCGWRESPAQQQRAKQP